MQSRMFARLFVVVLLLVAVPAAFAQDVITADNGANVTEIMRLGRGQVEVVDYSPDGSSIAVGSTLGVWLYSADALDTIAEPPLMITENPVSAIAFSPDGSIIAAGDDSQFVSLWDAATQEQLAAIDVSTQTYDLAFNSDGTQLATAHGDRTVRLWDVLEGTELAVMEGHTSTIYGVAFSPDDSVIASGADDRTVRLWDATNGSEIAVVEGHTGGIYDINFSPDGSSIVTGSSDYTVRFWDAATGEELLMIEEVEVEDAEYNIGHDRSVNATVFSPDGSVVATGSDDYTVRIWDAAGEQLAVVDLETSVEDFAFSPDGSQLATISGTTEVRLWNLADGSEISAALGHTEDIIAIDFTSDGENMVFADSDSNVWVWNRTNMAEITELPVSNGEITFSADNDLGVAFSPDDSYIAFTDGFSIQIWEADLSAQLGILEGDGLATNLAISPDSSLIVYVGSDGVFFFDVANFALLGSYFESTEWVQKIAWSPDQTYFATGADDGSVRIYAVGQ